MELNAERKEASEHTRKLQQSIREQMDGVYSKQEAKDIEEIKKHFILMLGEDDILDKSGKILWNRKREHYLLHDAPDTVNPYLWKMAQEEHLAGVVRLAENVYIVTGVDSATIGFIRSETGWIVQDALGSMEAVEIALNLVEKALNETVRDRIRAVIISHTHTDHLGGMDTLLKYSPEAEIYGPVEYEQSLVDDNLYAGIAMSRRLQYQCGLFLPHDEKGWVSIGLSSTLGVHGTQGEELPTRLVQQDGIVKIDGVYIYFLLTPHTETRAHMCSYFQKSKVLFLGDNSVGTLHNTYTMRGAPVRDANYWGKVFYHMYELFGEEVEAIYQGHGLPQFRTQEDPDHLKRFLLDNAVSYKYTHDQALLLANQGYTMNELGNKFQPREDIARTWYTRGHYGSYSFNARGTYQKYLGFYDGNPVNLLPLPERKLAEKLISYIGSEKIVLEKAKHDFEQGEYQWVATITNHLVYHNPDNLQARYLCADAFEQLGYQTENALWRNAYLSAAMELRNPDFAEKHQIRAMDNDEVIPFVSVDLLLDHLGINFDGEQAKSYETNFVLHVEDLYQDVRVYKGTVLHEKIQKDAIGERKVIPLTKNELYDLAIKKYAGKDPLLLELQTYIVDTRAYKNFALIEPLHMDQS